MPIDVTRIPALEEELRQAQNVKPGGQEPRPERIAAIEEQLRIHRKAAGEKSPRAEKAKDEAPAKAELETADAAPEKPKETTDAPKARARS